MTGPNVMEIYHQLQYSHIFIQCFLIPVIMVKLQLVIIYKFTMLKLWMKAGIAVVLLMKLGLQQNVHGWKLTVSCKRLAMYTYAYVCMYSNYA